MKKILLTLIFLIINFSPSFAESPMVPYDEQNAYRYAAIGDSTWYYSVGKTFAHDVKSEGFFKSIMNGYEVAHIRPMGIKVWAGLPFLLTGNSGDFIKDNYMIAALNLLCAMMSSIVLLSFFNFNNNSLGIKKSLMVIILTFSFVAFIPIILSDLVSLTFFLLGVSVLQFAFNSSIVAQKIQKINFVYVFLQESYYPFPFY